MQVGVVGGEPQPALVPVSLVTTGSAGRTILTADTNFYVAIGGSDSNPGTLAQPWATLQHAMNVISSTLDISGFHVTVNIAAGSFAGVGIKTTVGGGSVYFKGAGSSSTTIINGPNDTIFNSGECFSVYEAIESVIFIDKLKMRTTASVVMDVFASPCTIGLHDISGGADIVVDLSAMTGGPFAFLWQDAPGTAVSDEGLSFIGGGITIDWVWLIESSALYTFGNNGVSSTISGSLILVNAVCQADTGGIFSVVSNTAITGSGVVGAPFFAADNGTIAGQGTNPGFLPPNFFPGTTQGFCDQTSCYNGFVGSGLTYPQSTTILRTVLTGNTNFYVATTGNDSNNGSISAPWATLTHAMSFIAANLDIAGFTVTVNIAAGSFAGFGVHTPAGGGAVNFLGAGTASTTITAGPNDGVYNFGECVGCSFDNLPTLINLDGINFIPSIGFYGIAVYQPGFIGLGSLGPNSIKFTFPASGTVCCLTAQNAGATIDIYQGTAVTVDGTTAITGNNIFNIFDGAIIFDGGTWTMVGSPKFAPTILLEGAAVLTEYNASSYSGVATGQRFSVTGGSTINGFQRSGALGPNFFPGSTAGTVDASSNYDGLPGSNVDYQTPTTGFSITLANSDTQVILDPSGTLATGTITMQPNPFDGQVVTIRSSHTVTALTVSPNGGQTVVGAPTTIGVGGTANAVFKASNSTWYF